MRTETKPVSRVVLRGKILEQIRHAEQYKSFREILAQKYEEQKKAFFDKKWIAFSFEGKKGYWNKKLEVAVPVQDSYRKTESAYFDIVSAIPLEETIVGLFGSNSDCPAEIMQGIKHHVLIGKDTG